MTAIFFLSSQGLRANGRVLLFMFRGFLSLELACTYLRATKVNRGWLFSFVCQGHLKVSRFLALGGYGYTSMKGGSYISSVQSKMIVLIVFLPCYPSCVTQIWYYSLISVCVCRWHQVLFVYTSLNKASHLSPLRVVSKGPTTIKHHRSPIKAQTLNQVRGLPGAVSCALYISLRNRNVTKQEKQQSPALVLFLCGFSNTLWGPGSNE